MIKKKTITLIIILIILTLVSLFFYYGFINYRIYQHGFLVKNHLKEIQNNFQDRNFDQTKIIIKDLNQELNLIEKDINKLKFCQYLPKIKDNYQVINQLLPIAISLTISGEKIVSIAQIILEPLPEDSSYKKLSGEEKKELLERIQQTTPLLAEIDDDISSINLNLKNIDSKNLIGPVKEINNLANQYLPLISSSLDLLNSFAEVLPDFAGYQREKSHLIVMQNNDELRPTGGFIGVYGFLKVKDGTILDLQIADSYALDQTAEDYLNIEPPQAIREYLAPRWFLRDANWSPDFPTTAEKLLWFYQEERGLGNPQAVIAFDPELISDLLTVTGPLSIYDLIFNKDNFIDQLQYEVEQQFWRRGLKQEQRKDIIGQLGQQLIDKLSHLSFSELLKILEKINHNLEEKHILLYDRNPAIQNNYLTNNWAGQIQERGGDYLMVVDANMAALKTDRVTEKKINYLLQENKNGDLIALTTITYDNQGQYDYRTSRLRTYTRLYVPSGSKLIASQGALTNDRGDNPGAPGSVDIYQELNKTAFGAFTYVNPGETKSLIFEYQLPDNIKRQIKDGVYTLFVQKQPGTARHKLTIELKLDGLEKRIETDLKIDREIKIVTD